MPKLSLNKKLKRSVDDFETPVRVSKSVVVQTFLKKCEKDGSLFNDAFNRDIKSLIKYELKSLSFEDKVVLVSELRNLIGKEQLLEVNKVTHYGETFRKDCNTEDEMYLNGLVQKRVTASGIILDVTTSTEDLLTEKTKLTNMIQIIDDEIASRDRAKSVLVWQRTIEEIEANELSSANDYTLVVSSATNISLSRPRPRGHTRDEELPASTSVEVSEEGTPRG